MKRRAFFAPSDQSEPEPRIMTAARVAQMASKLGIFAGIPLLPELQKTRQSENHFAPSRASKGSGASH